MLRMMIYIAVREWSSKCWLPGPIGDPGEEFEVMAPRPGDLEVATAAPAGVITGNLLDLWLALRTRLLSWSKLTTSTGKVLGPSLGPGDLNRAAIPSANLLVLLLVRNLLVLHLLVRILLVPRLLVRILLVLTTTAGIGPRCNYNRNRGQLEADSTTSRPPRLNRRAAAAR